MALGVGDIFTIVEKSWKLFQILNDSRSSKKVYYDLKNQLFHLHTVLRGVAEAEELGHLAPPPGTEASTPEQDEHASLSVQRIEFIVKKCEETLDQIDDIVKDYRVIGALTDSDKKPFERIGQSLEKARKGIIFTNEEGKLNSLRSQVQWHMNSLEIALQLVNISWAVRIDSTTSSLTSQSEDIVEQITQISRWVEEIWTACSNATREGPDSDSKDPSTMFSIFEEGNQSSLQAKCDHARVFESEDGDVSSGRLFRCDCCDEAPDRHLRSHKHDIKAYILSDTTFPVRLAGEERAWIIYNVLEVSTSQKVTLRLTHITPQYMATFEDIMADLAARAISVMLQHGVESNDLVTKSSEPDEAYALEICSGLSGLAPKLEAVNITIGRNPAPFKVSASTLRLSQYAKLTTLERGRISDGSRLVLKQSANDSAGANPHASSRRSNQPTALLGRQSESCFEIDIHFGPEATGSGRKGDELAELNVICTKDTKFSIPQIGARPSSVKFQCVQVGFRLRSGETQHRDQVDIEVVFTSPEAAETFFKRVEEMRMELEVLHLTQPREDETIGLHLSGVKVDCIESSMTDADFTVLRNREGRYRLIVASRNRCRIFSQELVPEFFEHAKNTGELNFAYFARVVQIDNEGVRTVSSREKGFMNLHFGRGNLGDDGMKMLNVALQTLLLGD